MTIVKYFITAVGRGDVAPEWRHHIFTALNQIRRKFCRNANTPSVIIYDRKIGDLFLRTALVVYDL